MNGIKVCLFDDNDGLRDSIRMLLEDNEDIALIGAFRNCSTLLHDIGNLKPDVVIMDIDMPGMNGIEAVKLLRSQFPTVQVLMQTVFDDEEKLFAAISAGAGGYILKSAGTGNLLEAIKEVYNGGAPMTPSIARKVLSRIKGTSQTKEEYHLSSRETEVLSYLVKGLSYKMIADEMNITYDTVRAHMKKIYEKLHVSSMTEAVAKAIHQKLFSHE